MSYENPEVYLNIKRQYELLGKNYSNLQFKVNGQEWEFNLCNDILMNLVEDLCIKHQVGYERILPSIY